ncbi:MAG: hypothetical protein ACKOBG_03060 [Actinomycetota bacterium]
MALLVLLILAALWAVVLLPPLLRSRDGRTSDSIAAFNDRLALIGRTNGTLAPLPEEPAFTTGSRATRRRREVLRILLGAVGVTGLAAMATGSGALWALQIVADLVLLAFLGLWAWIRSLQIEQARKVRAIPLRVSASAAADAAFRRAVSS